MSRNNVRSPQVSQAKDWEDYTQDLPCITMIRHITKLMVAQNGKCLVHGCGHELDEGRQVDVVM